MSCRQKAIIRITLFILIISTTIINELTMYTTDQIGISFIKNAEGFSPTPYKCSAGKLTIGYGHVITDDEKIKTVTKEEAEKLLKLDIKNAESAINKYVSVPLNKGQFNALVSLVYNVGAGNFKKSKALEALNKSDYDLAAIEFFDKKKGFVKDTGIIRKGLISRRKKELAMWEGVDYA